MKAHIVVDAETGLTHSLATAAANVSDVATAHEVPHGGERMCSAFAEVEIPGEYLSLIGFSQVAYIGGKAVNPRPIVPWSFRHPIVRRIPPLAEGKRGDSPRGSGFRASHRAPARRIPAIRASIPTSGAFPRAGRGWGRKSLVDEVDSLVGATNACVRDTRPKGAPGRHKGVPYDLGVVRR